MAGLTTDRHITLEGDRLILQRGTHAGKQYQPACGPGCIGLIVVVWLRVTGALDTLHAAVVLAAVIAFDLLLGWVVMKRDRISLLDRGAREFREEWTTVFGRRRRAVPFDTIGFVQFNIDHDHDETEYKVKLGEPRVFKVCEIKDDYAQALEVAEAVAEFTGLPLRELEEDAALHPEQARLHRERVDAYRRDLGG